MVAGEICQNEVDQMMNGRRRLKSLNRKLDVTV